MATDSYTLTTGDGMFPHDWTRQCVLTIPADKISGTTHSNFPVLMTRANLPAELFDPAGSASVGGGDIRFSADVGGAEQLPCEVVTYTQDSTTGAGDGAAEIHVLVPTLTKNGTAGTTIYVWWGATAIQPAHGDAFGAGAVWVDYAAVAHGGSLANAATGIDFVASGNASVAGAGIVGGAITLDGTGDYLTATGLVPATGSANSVVTAFCKSSSSLDQVIVAWGADEFGDGARYEIGSDAEGGGAARLEVNNGWVNGTSDLSDGTWHHVAMVNTGDSTADLSIYCDGVLEAKTSSDRLFAITSENPLIIGAGYHSAGIRRGWNGHLDEVRVRTTALSDVTADWVATEYAALSSPATFVVPGTPEEAPTDAVIVRVWSGVKWRAAKISKI